MMNSRMSWINKPLLKSVIKNNLFPAKISLITFLGFFSLSIISSTGIGVVCIGIFGVSAIVLTTIYPSIIQSYLVDKTKSSMMRAIPLDVKCVWFTNYLAGYLIILGTLLIEGIGVVFIDLMKSYYFFYDGAAVYRYILMIFVLLFIYYTITFLVSSMSGNRLGQVIFSIVAYSLPVVLMLSFVLFSNYLVPGAINDLVEYYANLVFSLVAGIKYISDGDLTIFIHCFIALMLLGVSYYVYINRDDEYIGEPLVFHKIEIGLKLGIILIVSIMILYLIIIFGEIDITFGIKGMLTFMLIYLMVGIIVGIFVESIFKSNYIYRRLLVYVPILLIFFGINYALANNQYNRAVDDVAAKGDFVGSINIGDPQTEDIYTIEITHQTAVDLIDYLNDNRDDIHHKWIDRSKAIVDFNLYYDTKNNYHPAILQYQFDQQLFINYFNQHNKNYFTDLRLDFKDENFLIYYYNEQSIYLNRQNMEQLMQIVNDQKIVVDDFLDGKIISLSGIGNEYFIKSNEEIKHFLVSEELKEQSRFIQRCEKFINEYDYSNDTGDKKIYNYLREQLEINSFSLYNEKIELIDFDHQEAVYLLNLTAVDDKKSYNIQLEVSLESENDEIIISLINRKAGE